MFPSLSSMSYNLTCALQAASFNIRIKQEALIREERFLRKSLNVNRQSMILVRRLVKAGVGAIIRSGKVKVDFHCRIIST